MSDDLAVSNAEIFFVYAGKDLQKWNEIVSRKVVHIRYGAGTVEKVDECVYVNYNGETKRWVRRCFATEFLDVELPALNEFLRREIIEKIRQAKRKELEEERKRKAEEEERQAEVLAQEMERRRLEQERLEALRKQQEAMQEFNTLKAKYSASDYVSFSPFDRLHDVLLKLETEKALTSSDLKWLEEEQLFGVIATFYGICFSKSNDPWFLVRSSRYWRDKGEPKKALDLSLQVRNTSDRKLMSAILTTRGGAYRDLSKLSDAESCGLRAIQIDGRNHYPYSLMGAIYYQSGEPAKGDEFFKEARNRGATDNHDKEIRTAVKKADESSRKRIIAYLLSKDPARYEWVKAYAS